MRLSAHSSIIQALDGLVDHRIVVLIQYLPPPLFISLFLAYAQVRPGQAQSTWLGILRAIGSAAVRSNEPQVQLLSALLQDSRIPETLKANDELSGVVSLVLDKCLVEDQQFDMHVSLLGELFRKAGSSYLR